MSLPILSGEYTLQKAVIDVAEKVPADRYLQSRAKSIIDFHLKELEFTTTVSEKLLPAGK